MSADGRVVGTPPYEAGFYRKLCLNSPYLDFLKAHTQDILESLQTDGLFFDIVQPVECSCKFCRTKMEAEGLEPSDSAARQRFGLETINHFKLETLPGGGWGYMYFPVTMHYARTLGLECLGQTGKFHTSWGDFHSFKNLAALQYECFRMLAMGAKCMIDDQLHPVGRIDQDVYDLIGEVYAEVEKKEPWCEGAKAVTEIAVLHPEGFIGKGHRNLPPAIQGVTRMREEGGHQFDVVDTASNLGDYKVVVLPDYITVSPALVERLEAYVDNGGAVIASFASGLDATENGFALKSLGLRLQGEGVRDLEGRLVRGRHFAHHDFCDYVLPKEEIAQGLRKTEHAMYMRGMEVAAEPGSEVLADTVLPYFDRTYRHFCSHRQTPSSGRIGNPAIVRNGSTIYFSHPIFSQYEHNAPRWCKALFLNALDLLLPEPLVRHDGPTTMQVTINEQDREDRWILHLLHYIPERRGQDFGVLEDVIPLYDVRLSVRVPEKVEEVVRVPEDKLLDFEQKDGRVELVLPRLDGHQMIALDIAEQRA